MGLHRVEYVKDGQSRHRAICSCKSGSPYALNRQEAEDWYIKHMRLVEQAMTHLRNRAPSIKNQHDFFQSKADDPEETRENRGLWQQLANELKSRLARPSTDEPLPFEVKYTPKQTQSKDRA